MPGAFRIFTKLLAMTENNIITISPDTQSGTPVFAGTRVPVKNFFDYLKGGDTMEEFLHDFPSVSREQIDLLLQIMEEMVMLNSTNSREKSIA